MKWYECKAYRDVCLKIKSYIWGRVFNLCLIFLKKQVYACTAYLFYISDSTVKTTNICTKFFMLKLHNQWELFLSYYVSTQRHVPYLEALTERTAVESETLQEPQMIVSGFSKRALLYRAPRFYGLDWFPPQWFFLWILPLELCRC